MGRTIPGTASLLGLALAAAGVAAVARASDGPAPRADAHLAGTARAAVDAAIERGTRWLLARQDARGAFVAVTAKPTAEVALTAVALWAAAPSRGGAPEKAAAATEFLLRHRQPDGGIYDPRSGLAVYTSGIAAQALRALAPPPSSPLADAAHAVELFVYQHAIPESYVDLAEAAPDARADVGAGAARVLDSASGLTAEQKSALAFLARSSEGGGRLPSRTRKPQWKAPGAQLDAFSYDDMLPMVYLPLAHDHQIAQRAYEAVRTGYELDRNPDLTRRYGAAGFQPGTQGLYYYYVVLARALAVRATPWLTTADGRRHDWVRELSQKLVARQAPDGSWVNSDATWWEDEPVLVTSYALIALAICREIPADPEGR